jgi:hypothetical protein
MDVVDSGFSEAQLRAALSQEVLSLLSSVVSPKNLSITIRSESMTSFKYVFYSPVGKLYKLTGANSKS